MNLTAVTVFSRTAPPTRPACTLLNTHLLLFPESPDGQLRLETPKNPDFVVAVMKQRSELQEGNSTHSQVWQGAQQL